MENDESAFHINAVLTVYHVFLVLQTLVSSTAELTDFEISGLQEDLINFIMNQVLSLDGEHHLI
jgi:hypothetical protein